MRLQGVRDVKLREGWEGSGDEILNGGQFWVDSAEMMGDSQQFYIQDVDIGAPELDGRI